MRPKPALASILTGLALLVCTCGGTRAASKKYNLRKMTLVYAVLGKVRTRYVNPNRVDPKKMLRKALNNIQRKVPEVIVRKKGPSKVEIQVDDNKKMFKISDVGSPWDLTRKLEKIFVFIQNNLRPETKRQDVEYAAVDGILDTLDPHSVLMRPAFFRQMEVDTSGSFGGLGIEISICDGKLTIRRPLKHTPAWNTKMKYGRRSVRIEPPGQEALVKKSGPKWVVQPLSSSHPSLKANRRDLVVRLRAGDKILRINEESTVNMTLQQAVKRLRGKPDTDLVIWIRRSGWRKARPFAIRRAKIGIPSVSHRTIGGQVGYIKLKKFQATTITELKRAVMALKGGRKGSLKGLVLDLRNNHGGLLDQAVRVADAFVTSGTLVSTMGFAGIRRRELRARKRTTIAPGVPMVILVNGESASAAEIVAAALKQLNRAVVIGDNTFGKGSVQVIFRTPNNTGLKLTVSQWFAPGNFSIQRVGLTPDIRTIPVRIRKDKPIIFHTAKRRRRGERDYRAALKQGKGSTSLKTKPYLSLHYLKKPIPEYARGFHCRFCGQSKDYEPPPNPDIFLEDAQIGVSKRLLLSAGTSRRLRTLAKSKRFFAKERRKQESKIVAAFKKIGIDWSRGTKGNGSVSLIPKISIGKRGKIRGGQKLQIKVEVTNRGDTPASRVRAETFSTNNRMKNLEFFFGKIPPGKSRVAMVEVRIPKGYPAQKDKIRFKFFEGYDRAPKPVDKEVQVQSLDKPEFAYTYHLKEAKGADGDGLFEVGEKLELLLTVKNTGKGPTQEAYAEMSNLSGTALFVQKGRFKVKRLRPGARRTYRFTFELKKIPAKSHGIARVRVKVRDCVMGAEVGERLVFKIWPQIVEISTYSNTVKPRASMFKNGKELYLRLCPDARCSPLARVHKNSSFKATKRVSGWLLTTIKGRKAFIKKSSVQKTSGRARPKADPFWEVIPPKIKVSKVKQVVRKKSITIRGRATHVLGIADVFIRVSNVDKDIFSRKVFYKSSLTHTKNKYLDFSAQVPLWEGKNLVEIVARENDRVTTSEVFVILKTPVKLEKKNKVQ